MKYVLALCIGTVLLVSLAVAQEGKEEKTEYEDTLVIKTMDGLRFKVQKDRPLVRKDGIVKPMEMDEYIAMKFSKLEDRLTGIEEAMSALEGTLATLEERLASCEEKKPKEQ